MDLMLESQSTTLTNVCAKLHRNKPAPRPWGTGLGSKPLVIKAIIANCDLGRDTSQLLIVTN
jgi:hypothetical protein